MSGLWRAARIAGPLLSRARSAAATPWSCGRLNFKEAFPSPLSSSCCLLLRGTSSVPPNSYDAGSAVAKDHPVVFRSRAYLEFDQFRRSLYEFVKAEDLRGFWKAVDTTTAQMTLAHYEKIFSLAGTNRLFYNKKASKQLSEKIVQKLYDYVHFTVSVDGIRHFAETSDAEASTLPHICSLFHGFQWLDPSSHGKLLTLLARDLMPVMEKDKQMTSRHAAMCLYKMLSMGHLLSSGSDSKEHDYHRVISVLSNKLETAHDDEALTVPVACGLFLALGNATNDHPAVRQLLRVATGKLKQAFSGVSDDERVLSLEHLTRVLSGIRAMSLNDLPPEDTQELKELLDFVSTLQLQSGSARPLSIDDRSQADNRSSPRSLNPSVDYVHTNGARVSVALNSLRGYCHTDESALGVLRMLDTQLVRQLPPSCTLDASNVARAMQGLRLMDMHNKHTASVISFLCSQLQQSGACSLENAKAIVFHMSSMKNVADIFLLQVLPHLLDRMKGALPGASVVFIARILKESLGDSYSSPEVTREAREAVWRRVVHSLLTNYRHLEMWTDRDVVRLLRSVTRDNHRMMGELAPVLVRVLAARDKKAAADPRKAYDLLDKEVVACITSLAVLEEGGVHTLNSSPHIRGLLELVISRIYRSSRDMDGIEEAIRAAGGLSPAVQGVLQLVRARSQTIAEDSMLVKNFGYDMRDLSLGLQSITEPMDTLILNKAPEGAARRATAAAGDSAPDASDAPYDIESIKSTITSLSEPLLGPRPSLLYPRLDFFSSLRTLKELADKDDSSASEFWDYVDINASRFNISHISLIFGLCANNCQTKPGYLINPKNTKTIVSVLHQRLQLSGSDQDAVTPRVLNNCLKGISAIHFFATALDVATLQTLFRSISKMTSLLQHESMTIEEITSCLYPLRHAMLQRQRSSILRRDAAPLFCFLAEKLDSADPLRPDNTSTNRRPMTIAQINMCLAGIHHYASTERLQRDPASKKAIGTILRIAANHLRERRFLEAVAMAERGKDAKAPAHGPAHLKRLMLMLSYVRGIQVIENSDPLAKEVRDLVLQIDDSLRAIAETNRGLFTRGVWREFPAWQEHIPQMISGLTNKSDAYPEILSLMRTINTVMLPAIAEGNRPGSTGSLLKCSFSLRNMDCATEEVQHLLKFFFTRVHACNHGPKTSKTLEEASALGSHVLACVEHVKNMKNSQLVYPDLISALLGRGDEAEAGVLLTVIGPSVVATMLPQNYNAQVMDRVLWRARQMPSWPGSSIATMMHNMQNYSCDDPNVLAMVWLLHDRMRYAEFSIEHVLVCLEGMRGMSSVHAEVRATLKRLTKNVRSIDTKRSAKIDSAAIEKALNSLNKFDAQQKEVADLVMSLTAMVHAQRDKKEEELGGSRRYGGVRASSSV